MRKTPWSNCAAFRIGTVATPVYQYPYQPPSLEFIEEILEIFDLGLDEKLDLVGFVVESVCICLLVEDLSEVGFAATVPSEEL